MKTVVPTWWVFSLACSGATTHQTSDPTTGPVPIICDGSDEVRFSYGDWAGGAADIPVDFVMYAEGMRFLRIYGTCRFVAFDGETVNLRWWEPVVEGQLDPQEVVALMQELQIWELEGVTEADLANPNAYHAAWNRFEVGDDAFLCPQGCPEGSRLWPLIVRANSIVRRLFAAGSPVEDHLIEVAVVETRPVDFPLIVPWGADIPLLDVVQDTRDAAISGDPADIGVFVEGDAMGWFLEMRTAYRESVMPAAPSAIGILNEDGELAYRMYMRSVVP